MSTEKDIKAAEATQASNVEDTTFNEGRKLSADEIRATVRSGSIPNVHSTKEAIEAAQAGGWEADALIEELEKELQASGKKKGHFDLEFDNPKHFTWLLVAFASVSGPPHVRHPFQRLSNMISRWEACCLAWTNLSSLAPTSSSQTTCT